MRTRHRARVVSLTTALLLVGAGALAAGPPAAAATASVTIIQHNVEKKWSPIQAAVNEANAKNAEGITLQEVCKSDFRTLKKDHPNWTVVYTETRANRCPVDGVDQGVGVVVVWRKGNDGARKNKWLPKDDGRTPRLLCIAYRSKGKRYICSTHLALDAEVRLKQTGKIKRITSTWIEDGASVIVGGDFNAKPNQAPMDKMYKIDGGNGRFTEADQKNGKREGDATASRDRKIDYVFYSVNRTKGGQAQGITTTPTDSDHRMLTATAGVDLS